VRALSESLYFELKPFGVSVTHVAPGFIVSEIRKIDNQGNFHEKAKDPIPMWLQMPAEKAAKKLVKATLKRKPEIVITFHGKLAVGLQRHFPRIFRTLLATFSVKARPQP
jgi:short-subunit dehydrogenase